MRENIHSALNSEERCIPLIPGELRSSINELRAAVVKISFSVFGGEPGSIPVLKTDW